MSFPQLLVQFLQPVILFEQFWEDQEMEKFVAEFGQWNGQTLYVNPTGSQLCYYKLPTFYDAVTKMFQTQLKGLKYSALTDEGFIEFSHSVHDFYDVNISMIQFRSCEDPEFRHIMNDLINKVLRDPRVHKLSFMNAPYLEDFLKSFTFNNQSFEKLAGSTFVLYK